MIPLLAAALACAPCVIEDVRVEVGDGTVLERTTVVLDRGRIVSVGGAAPAGGTRLDGSGRTLTPGLIEARSQIGLLEVGAEPSTDETRIAGESLVPAFSAADGFNPASAWIPIVREEGVTSVVVAPSGGVLSGRGFFVDLTGELASAPDPSRPVAMFGAIGESAAAESGGARGSTWLRLRQAFADARFYQQKRAEFDRGEARDLTLHPLHLEALAPVLAGRLPLVLEAHRASDLLAALRFAQAEQVRIVISGGAESWKVAAELAAAKVPVIVRPSVQAPASFEALDARDDLAAVLESAGVPLILTSSGWSPDARRLRQEAGLAVAYGLPRPAALRAITSAPALAFGMESEVGTVAPGRRANVVLWSGDPLELRTAAERVFIDGVERPVDHRQRRLVERYRSR